MSITEDMLISYALGHLTPEEEAVVEAHLRAHPEDAATVAAYLDGLAELVLALPPEPLADGGEAALLARVRGVPDVSVDDAPMQRPVVPPRPPRAETAPPTRSRARWYGWLGPLAAAAAVALLYITVLSVWRVEGLTAELAELREEGALLEAQLRESREALAEAQASRRTAEGRLAEAEARLLESRELLAEAHELQEYQAQPGAVSYALTAEGQPDPLGTLVRLSDGRVFVALEAPPAGDRVYQAWAIAEAPVSLGTFDGRTFLSAAAVSEGETFGLTLEPPGGSEQPTTTPLTLVEL